MRTCAATLSSLLVLAVLIANTEVVDAYDCADINSAENSIFGSVLCGDLISRLDGNEYNNARQQYSTLNPDSGVNTLPSFIIQPDASCNDNDTDIQLAIFYAKQCDHKINIRSGGHQWNGLSSCSYLEHKCIQIDMIHYDIVSILNNKVNNNKIIKSGVGISLNDLWINYLAPNNIFFQTGSCSTVHLGGHIQTGGYGDLLRFGTAGDHVIGFEIVLSDGIVYHINNPIFADKYERDENLSKHEYNDFIFGGVLGGGPGSFGVVTNVYLRTHSDFDYLQNIFYKIRWRYNATVFEQVGYKYVDLLNSEKYRNDPNQFISLDATEDDIVYTGWWVMIEEGVFDDNIYIDPFYNIDGASYVVRPTANNTITYNQIHHVVHPTNDWQFKQSLFNRKQYAFNDLNYDIIDILNAKINFIHTNPELGIRNAVGSIEISDDYALNSKSIRDFEDHTFQQRRHALFGVFVEGLAYNTTVNRYARGNAIRWINDLFAELLNNEAFDGDYRTIGFTNSFDEFDITKEWRYYYDDKVSYNAMRYLKTKIDSNNIFNGNKMTVPPFNDTDSASSDSSDSYSSDSYSSDDAVFNDKQKESIIYQQYNGGIQRNSVWILCGFVILVILLCVICSWWIVISYFKRISVAKKGHCDNDDDENNTNNHDGEEYERVTQNIYAL